MIIDPDKDLLLADMQAPRLQSLDIPALQSADVSLKVLRLDLMHPHLGGNKWFKLHANINAILAAGRPLVVSFGGAYSNHIRALAAAGREFGFPTLAYIRGELTADLNPVLRFARDCGMELRSLGRSDYRRKSDPEFLQQLTQDLGPHYVLPEGGSNALAIHGCQQIARYIEWQEDSSARFVALPCGTGATMAGLIQGLAAINAPVSEVLGVSVLKAPGYLHQQVEGFLVQDAGVGHLPWRVIEDYHCGGYARCSQALGRFLDQCRDWDLPVEPVYTGKLFYALHDMASRGVFAAGSEIIAIHTGGVFSSQTP